MTMKKENVGRNLIVFAGPIGWSVAVAYFLYSERKTFYNGLRELIMRWF